MLYPSLGDAYLAAVDAMAGSPVLRFGNIQTTREAFRQIFGVFVGLGTLVGVVVLSYMLYKGYKYRAGSSVPDEERADPPELGELPSGKGEGGRKLFLSFGLSAVIVLSLIFWTYGTLLLLSDTPEAPADDQLNVTVEGYQFGWTFIYPNGHETNGELRVPNDTVVNLEVTSQDVMHNLGLIPFERKTDAIPGQTTEMWILPEETATYEDGVVCYELCGSGHSLMTGDIVVMERDAFDEWYASTGDGGDGGAATTGDDGAMTMSHDEGSAGNATATANATTDQTTANATTTGE